MTASSSTLAQRFQLAAWLASCLCALVLSGCGVPDLATQYGRQQSTGMMASVNGTDLLAELFTKAGHKTYFRRTLVTDELSSADVIIWFPNDYSAPTDEVCEWFDGWLAAVPGRTVVYVGRDYDAAPVYWKTMMARGPKDKRNEYQELLEQAERRDRLFAKLKEVRDDCPLLTLKHGDTKKIDALQGEWAEGIDASKCDIQVGTTVTGFRVAEGSLLRSGDVEIVGHYSHDHWDESQIILIANGSFLLNLPLVNHEHCKLAGKLIEAVGPPGRVVFLESGPGGPPVDPPYSSNSLWTLFSAWPLGPILLQLAVMGIIFCFARWPIFGRPQQPAAESLSDFGKHVDAVGRLLARTRKREFAVQQVPQAQQSPSPSATLTPVQPFSPTTPSSTPPASAPGV